ncbi:MAG: hypothetical protein A2534_01015 [Candidatus Magasanikbacteria bacterium RIFOXYD2_FULL_39_9]|uniref:Uncharacterized protein n=1 Tax=Candidatus Magasanikbacteria bacterium RIFOXYD1_FULL_40_23 TaxID=1798705 RepID=A0A1F6P8L1_9BACT|nr:MAG: hypothetical protein A2563_02420 [Candidatus Magasanikbacteria bacterium RIFOXYD1_FULL_40_23]OGH93165.1 MAG: hypothetical protein A2534_01015 [Candidatus Magasanikbacteria bacterium RIFOXYD2_FULL_39_9]
MRKISLFAIIILLGAVAFPSASFGVMSSTNYTIFADSIDAGGVLSTSGTYSLEDTIGETPTGGSVTSSVYEVLAGYQAMDWSVLVLDVDTNTINLGTLSTSAVTTSSATLSVTVDASSGYVLSVGSVSGTSLTAVADGAVSAGTEEYGIAVSGIDAAFADDQAITAGLNVSSSSTLVTYAETVVTFKAAISSASAAASLSQSITFSASTSI